MTGPHRAAVVLLLLALTACGGGEERDDLRSPAAADNFSNGREAAGAIATVADRLIDRGADCVKDHGRQNVRCQTLGVASAWAQLAAVDVAHCGRAGALEARATLLELLDAVEAAEDGDLESPPRIPDSPDCR